MWLAMLGVQAASVCRASSVGVIGVTMLYFHSAIVQRFVCCLFVVMALPLTGCTFIASTLTSGALYTNTRTGKHVTAAPGGELEGWACKRSYLGLVGIGDASIETARKNGLIGVVSSVDEYVWSVLFGTYTKVCTIVHGGPLAASTHAASSARAVHSSKPAKASESSSASEKSAKPAPTVPEKPAAVVEALAKQIEPPPEPPPSKSTAIEDDSQADGKKRHHRRRHKKEEP